MISTSWRPRTRRVLIAAVLLSVLIHLFGGAAYDYARHVLVAARLLHEPIPKKDSTEFVATSDVIHIEKRTVPRQTRPQRPAPRPRPESRPEPQRDPNVPPVAVPKREPEQVVARAETPRPIETLRPERSHETKKPAPRLAAVRTGGLPDVTPEPKPETIERTTPRPTRAHAQTRRTNPALSPKQIASLESEFEKTIQASREDLPSASTTVKTSPGAPHPSRMNFEGIQSVLRQRQGEIHSVRGPIALANGFEGWVMQYTMIYPDGHIETDIIPWLFVYPVSDDPVHRAPTLQMQLPPPDFRPSRPLKPMEEEAYESAQRLEATASPAP